ncbi:MAG TPA: hypothetical protein VFV92_08295 [Candidatus Bathyarchaeia archaeon]|nr:hypothetical protein [Candidatus Bathyarchaeia archaeon]
MRSKVMALVAVTLVAALIPAVMAVGATASQAAAHANHTPGTAQCTFTHPSSLPSQASSNATAALAARSTHCPPTIPTH